MKDFLASPEIENIFENSDFLVLLSQAQGDRQILAKQLGISPHQLSYVTHTNSGEGLLFFGNTTIPFVDHFPQNTELYAIMTTRPEDKKREPGKGAVNHRVRNRNRNRRRKLRARADPKIRGRPRETSGPSRRLRFEDEDAPEGNETTSGQHGPKPKGGKFRQDDDQPRPSDRMRQEDAPGGGEPSGTGAGGLRKG